jgi:GntR family transcriptional regulator
MGKAIKNLINGEAAETDSYRMVKARLREAIDVFGSNGQYRLPSEAELTTQLGASRVTIRSALQSLQKEGRIRRLHGHGTFINRHAMGVRANLGEATPFLDLLADSGYKAEVRILAQKVVPLDAELAAALEVEEGTEALCVERVFYADGEPAVHSVDHVPVGLLRGRPEDVAPRRSTFENVEATGLEVCYSVAEVRPVVASRAVAVALNVKRSQPLLSLRHTHVTRAEVPVAATVVHVNDEYLRFSVIRTYLDQ